MRSLKHLITGLALVIGLVLSAQAENAEPAKPTETAKVLKNQTNCPVMGGKIDSTTFTDIQGQRVYHCCPMCSATLKADPDKYFKKAAEEGILFENIQTTCPVSGEQLQDKSVFTDYEGRRIVFCCEKCLGTFNEDPAKYLKKLDERTETKSETMQPTDHSGHNH
jgi:YHS domain-containing protein